MKTHQIALWSAAAAFFGYLLLIGIFDVLDPDRWIEYIGAFVVAAITGGAMYAKERLAEAKREEKAAPRPGSRKGS